MRTMNAQLVHEVRRRCNGATVHVIEQLLCSLPMLIKVHNSPKCKDKDVVARQIDDLESRLWALAYRKVWR